MSDYQYYEFRTIDRRLDDKQLRELRRFSRRARITPTSFQIHYDWSDFRGDPKAMVEKYFDAFVYLASGGSRRLEFRFPKKLVDLKALKRYDTGGAVRLWTTRLHAILSFRHKFEDDCEGEGWLDSLVELRAALMAGDRRAAYLGWLMGVALGDVPPESEEPPVPSGLDELTPALEGFVRFFRIDADLVAAAGSRSGAREEAVPTARELASFIKAIPVAEKDVLLLRAIKGDVPHLRAELLLSFEDAKPAPGKTARKKPEPRTAAQLLAAADRRAATRSTRA